MNEKEFSKEFIELFGFLLSQEFAINAPKDTGRLSKSFPATFKVNGKTLEWTPPFYWEYLEYGTIKMRPNPFVRLTLEKDLDKIAKKTIEILSKR